MWKSRIAPLCVIAAMSLGQSYAHAEPITIQNASFEDTDASASPYYVANSAAHWTTNGYWIATIYNTAESPHGAAYTGVDESQYLGISSWATAVDQILSDTFEAGKTYKLTASLCASSSDHSNTTATVAVRLFYGDSEEPSTMAANTVGTIEQQIGSLSTSAMTDYSVTITSDAIATAGAVGKKIGIEIAIPTNGPGANFGVDNIRLDIVPEPSAIVLFSTGILGLLAYAWRKRK